MADQDTTPTSPPSGQDSGREVSSPPAPSTARGAWLTLSPDQANATNFDSATGRRWKREAEAQRVNNDIGSAAAAMALDRVKTALAAIDAQNKELLDALKVLGIAPPEDESGEWIVATEPPMPAGHTAAEAVQFYAALIAETQSTGAGAARPGRCEAVMPPNDSDRRCVRQKDHPGACRWMTLRVPPQAPSHADAGWPDYYHEAVAVWPELPERTEDLDDLWRNHTREENARWAIDRLRDALAATEDDRNYFANKLCGTAAALERANGRLAQVEIAVRESFPLANNEGYEEEDAGVVMYRMMYEDGDVFSEADTAAGAVRELARLIAEVAELSCATRHKLTRAVAIAREAVEAYDAEGIGAYRPDIDERAGAFRAALAEIGE